MINLLWREQLHNFLGKGKISFRPPGIRGIYPYRLAVRGGFSQPDIAGNDGRENISGKMPSQFI
jgi:hypothetical protein